MLPPMPPDGLLPHLIFVARKSRGKTGRGKVAAAAGVDQDTVRRFEVEPSWKRETDNLVAGYATLAKCEPADLWREAIHRWDQATRAGDGNDLPEVEEVPPPNPEPEPPARTPRTGRA